MHFFTIWCLLGLVGNIIIGVCSYIEDHQNVTSLFSKDVTLKKILENTLVFIAGTLLGLITTLLALTTAVTVLYDKFSDKIESVLNKRPFSRG